MNETMSGGSPEMIDYTGMQTWKLIEMYALLHQKATGKLGRPGDESYAPEVGKIVDQADELYELGLREHGQEQKIKYIAAFQKLKEVEYLN